MWIYKGLASCNLDEDLNAIKTFLDEDLEIIICESHSKNFNLYGERVGCLHFVCHD